MSSSNFQVINELSENSLARTATQVATKRKTLCRQTTTLISCLAVFAKCFLNSAFGESHSKHLRKMFVFLQSPGNVHTTDNPAFHRKININRDIADRAPVELIGEKVKHFLFMEG